MSEAKIRADFDEWYATNAFDYARDPIGSRDCGLQWKAWQAACAHKESEFSKEREQLRKLIAIKDEALEAAKQIVDRYERNYNFHALAIVGDSRVIRDKVEEALSVSAESVAAWEAEKLEPYNWLWNRCRIIFFPKADDELGTYPIEHNPFAKKDGRMFIEAKMKAELRAKNAQKKE